MKTREKTEEQGKDDQMIKVATEEAKKHVDLNLPEVTAGIERWAEIMRWFQLEGNKMLTDAGVHLDYGIWDKMFQKACMLFRDLGNNLHIKTLFRMVVRRGIIDLLALATSGGDKETIETWFRVLISQFKPDRINPLSGHYFDAKEAFELLDLLISVAQAAQSENLLGLIAQKRMPQDESTQRVFVSHHKNW